MNTDTVGENLAKRRETIAEKTNLHYEENKKNSIKQSKIIQPQIQKKSKKLFIWNCIILISQILILVFNIMNNMSFLSLKITTCALSTVAVFSVYNQIRKDFLAS